MKNTIGPPVSGDDFRYRTKNLSKAIRYLENGNSFLILGIRRTGKSSFLQQTAYQIKNKNPDGICIELDCQTFDCTLDFYQGLYNEMPQNLRLKFKSFLNSSKQLPKKLIHSITEHFEAVEFAGTKISLNDKLVTYSKPFEEIVTKFFKETEHVYLFIDELPFFFENVEKRTQSVLEITQILSTLRSWRHAGVSMGITGSLNLHHQLDNLNISRKLLAGLNSIELGPFTKEESFEFLKELRDLDGFDWFTDSLINKLLKLLPDHIPYFLQYGYNEAVVNECKKPKEIEEVYHNEITPGLFKDFIYQFEERLAFLSESIEDAMVILDGIAIAEPITLSDLKKHTKGKLNYDVLIQLIDFEFIKLAGEQTYSFSLQIIKIWWTTKRGL